MAQTGVYRESLFETFRPLATRRQIRTAIAQAKQYGLQSVPSLRDETLGTYYQADSRSAETFQAALKQSLNWDDEIALADRMVAANQAIRGMLAVMATTTVGLGLVGGWYLLAGQAQTGRVLWLCTLVVAGLWGVQRSIAKRQL